MRQSKWYHLKLRSTLNLRLPSPQYSEEKGRG